MPEETEAEQVKVGIPVTSLECVQKLIQLLIEETIPEPKRALTLETAGECLTTVGKIWLLETQVTDNSECEPNSKESLLDIEGYVDEYQYLHIQATDKALNDIRILPRHFAWLLSADLSGNRLDNVLACPLSKLANLVKLQLDRNRFIDPYLPCMKHLQYLTLARNKVSSIHRIHHPNLETLDLNDNDVHLVDSEDCWKLPRLRELRLSGNHLRTTKGFHYPQLTRLYLARNHIDRLEGLDVLVALQRLHLRENPLTDLTGFTAVNAKLQYLNLRKCQLQEARECAKLKDLLGLRVLVIKENLFNPPPEKKEDEEEEQEEEEDNAELRVEILTYLPALERIDKRKVTEEERQNAKELLDE